MRVFRHIPKAVCVLALISVAILSSGCDYTKKVIAKDKLNQGAISYNQGRTKEAQKYFRDSLKWDDKSAIAHLFYGATLVKDYKNVEGPDKTRLANEALETYKKALDLTTNNCRNRDNAISYIASIYDDLQDNDNWREWILKRAETDCATKDVKATTFYTVAVKYWEAAKYQTDRYQEKGAQDPFHYRNMDYAAASADKVKAEEAVAKGLEFIEKALQEDPKYVDALYYKSLLYRQRQMLTKEESKRKELDSLAKKLSEEATALDAAKKQQEEQNKPKG
ncbi:MAG: hypothetical protein KA368_01485 [Acidobacteria bacterium]|nr:hypothetical protein [Acidobacteriota bacterium]